MKRKIPFLALLLALFSCQIESNQDPLIQYLESNHSSPNEYVIKKFQDHDVIFMGENHYIKEQVDLIKDLIPDLHQNGIYYLGTEFLNYEDTELANQLITAETFDEELAKQISFNSLWHWGYEEYIDIYREAWKLNNSLAEDAAKFQIFGIQEYMDFSYVNSEEDFNNPEIMAKVFAQSYDYDEEEGFSANAVKEQVLDRNEKALIHCGIHHGFTSYFQPIYDQESNDFAGNYVKERMGNLVKNMIGERTMTIFIHGPWYARNDNAKQVPPVDGVLDSLFALEANQGLMPFGVDTKMTAFGELTGESSRYQYGYEDFTLKDFCDGYIFLEPIKDYETVTPISNFIRADQVDFVKAQEFEYREYDLTAENLNDSIRIWLEKESLRLKEMED